MSWTVNVASSGYMEICLLLNLTTIIGEGLGYSIIVFTNTVSWFDVPAGDATSMDCPYDPEHPKYGKDVQPSQVYTVRFHGSLSDFQDEEERVRRGHPDIPAIKMTLPKYFSLFLFLLTEFYLFSKHTVLII